MTNDRAFVPELLVLPRTVTKQELRRASFVLGQVIGHNADRLPFKMVSEAMSTRFLLDDVIEYAPVPVEVVFVYPTDDSQMRNAHSKKRQR
jgi:hypothetical protein